MAKKDPNSRLSRMREIKVGESVYENRMMPASATVEDARNECRKMARAVCSSVNILKKEGFQFETVTGTLLANNSRMICILAAERIG